MSIYTNMVCITNSGYNVTNFSHIVINYAKLHCGSDMIVHTNSAASVMIIWCKLHIAKCMDKYSQHI